MSSPSVPTVNQDQPSAVDRFSISVVIPAKNEALNIGWVLERMPPYVDEVIVVDGLSTDGTLEVAKSITPDVIVVHELTPGKGAAMRAGMEMARGDIVVVLDADGSMHPAEIERYVDAIAAGAELAKGSRFVDGGDSTDITWLRAFGNRQLLRFANVIFGTNFSELCYGYMALARAAIPRLALDADGFEIETQIVTRSIRAGLRIVEVPSSEAPRRFGVSNLNAVRDGWRVLRTLLEEWRLRGAPPARALVPIPMQLLEQSRAVEETTRMRAR